MLASSTVTLNDGDVLELTSLLEGTPNVDNYVPYPTERL